ncbi:WxL domain-containing protein [Enterococcus termitis]
MFHDATFSQATVLTVTELVDAVLTVEFTNELGQILPGYTITIDGLIGDEIDLTKEERVVKQLEELMNAGYEIAERPANETMVILDSTEVTVQYKLQGILSLASAPNALDFGSLAYNATTKRVEDPSIDQPLIVTDTRADTANGWTLTASLSSPMRNSDGQELVNALRYVYKGQETILDANDQTVYLNTNGSAGSFEVSDSWGNQSGTDGVKLQIGSSDTIHTGNYVGVITWKVMAGQP